MRAFALLALRAADAAPRADTGDGGNSTYCVARALAAPQLTVNVPEHLAAALPPPARPAATHANDSSASAAVGSAAATRSVGEREAGGGAGGTRLVLPRGDVLLLGGDLAYPNPTK